MDDRNPYAPSPASLQSADTLLASSRSGTTSWRSEKLLVMIPDTPLPPRCVKCNAPAEEPTKVRKIYWHHTGVYALVLVNILIYAIVAMIVRKRALVAPGLCGEHKKRRQLGLLIGWGGVLAGLALLMWGVNNQSVYMGLGVLVLLGAALAGVVLSRVVVARRINKEYVWLKGCGAEFLDSLPPLP